MAARSVAQVVKIEDFRLSASVDRLADINSQIRRLEAEATELKGLLLEAGSDEICGTKARAVITHAIRESLDSGKVKVEYPGVFAKCLKAIPVHSVSIKPL